MSICKKISAWLDYYPPGALTGKGWGKFRREFKANAPIRYWLKDTAYFKYYRPVINTYNSVEKYVKHRTVSVEHIIHTGLGPGHYPNMTRMVYANFSIFADYIETTIANRNRIGERETFFERYFPFFDFFRKFRNQRLALEYLEYRSIRDQIPNPDIYDIADAKDAREKLALYKWWVFERPAREIPFVPPIPRLTEEPPSDDDDFGLGLRNRINRKSPEYAVWKEAYAKKSDVEEEWAKEDQHMLERLVKIAHELYS